MKSTFIKRIKWTAACLPVCLTALLLVACEENDNDPLPAPTDPYASGTFVVNEGPFTSGSGSLSHVDEDGQVVKEAFFLANGFPLGSVLQSAELVGDELYIVANLSGRIEVVQKGTLNALRSTQLLGSPRYVQELSDGRVAATDWATDKVFVLNASDLSMSQSFDVGVGPERMAVLGDQLYVLNSGGFGRDSTVHIIHTASNSVMGQMVLGDQPNSLQVIQGRIWVLCSGYADWSDPANDTQGKLIEMDADGQILSEYPIDLAIGHPGELIYDQQNNRLCFLNNAYGGSIMAMDFSAPGSFFELKKGSYYSLDHDPIRGQIVAGNALSFDVPGYMIRFGSDMSLVDSVQVGLIPTDFVFH
jgi:DNA-binding beta-propeller fold protein YncE